MIRPHLAHEPLRFDSVDMLRLEVRWVDVKGQWDGRDGTRQKERALFCLYLGLRPADKSQPWPPQAVCRVGGQCLSNNLACWAAQVPLPAGCCLGLPAPLLLVRPPAPP